MNDRYTPQAISDINDPNEIRVVIFINNEFVHVPLMALLKDIEASPPARYSRRTREIA